MNETNIINQSDLISSSAGQVSSSETAQELGRKITWVHGTNSSTLAMIPATGYALIPTGKLLDREIAPMTGQIKGVGMMPMGINQRFISGSGPREMEMIWTYATNTNHLFTPPRDFSEAFSGALSALNGLTPEYDGWDPILIDLLRLKQWDPEKFAELCLDHAEEIESIKTKAFENGTAQKILRAIDYPVEKLEKAKEDEEIRKEIRAEFSQDDEFPPLLQRIYPVLTKLEDSASDPNDFTLEAKDAIRAVFHLRLHGKEELSEERIKMVYPFLSSCEKVVEWMREKTNERIEQLRPRYNRMLNIFKAELSVVTFETNEKREKLLHPFPILFASTTIEARGGRGEYAIPQAQIGTDIDKIFTEEVFIPSVEEWLQTNGLQNRVAVHSSSLIPKIVNAVFEFA